MVNITKSKQITTLPLPKWVEAVGRGKGLDHDRQHLGIVLEAEQVIKVRQTNAAFTDKLTLRLLNDDNKTESLLSFANDWVELSVKAASVPFIDTPYTQLMPTVEFSYPETAKTLPVYRKGENESEFFALWDSKNAEFALVESKYAIILVPSVDKEALRAMGKADDKRIDKVDNIDGMMDYYEDIFSHYNKLAGLSLLEPERPTDRDVGNRYFLKADKHGAGGAYCGSGWVAVTSSSINGFCIPPGDQWALLHEIGHGYEVRFASKDFGRGAIDIWNNIYANDFQKNFMDDPRYQAVGWLYNFGHRAVVEKTVIDLINTGKALKDWDLPSKLYFMDLMVKKAGTNAFAHLNQQFRLHSSSDPLEEHELLDMLSKNFAVVGNQVDVTPFVQLVKGYITPLQREYNSFSHGKAVYPLNQLVQESKLAELQQQWRLPSPLSLVDVEQLWSLQIKSDVKLRLNIDDFSQIHGENLVLLDGTRAVRELLINSQDLALNKLPIGVYTMRLPTGKDKKYDIQNSYLVVKQGEQHQQVDFVPKLGSSLIAQKIEFTGLGDALVARVSVDHVKRMVTMDVLNEWVDSYYPQDRYIEVTVCNQDNTEKKFNKTMYGLNNTKGHDEVPFAYGDKIEIFYLGGTSHVHLIPPSEGMLADSSKATHILEITPSGLKNEALGKDSQTSLLQRVEKAAAAIRDNYVVLNANFAGPKDELYLAINTFASPQREELLAKYADCISSNNAAPGNKLTLKSGSKIDFAQLQKDPELAEPQQDISPIQTLAMPDISQALAISATALAGDNISESL